MFCNNCGAQNADNQKFCATCGSPLNNDQNAQQQYGQQQYNAYQQPMGGNQSVPQAQPVFFGGIQERNIALYVIASLFTGVFLFYWMYTATEDTNKLSGDPNATSGGMVILFSILTCGIYTWYWMYKRGEILDNFYRANGYPGGNDRSVVYLLLSIFGLGIVSYGLMQNELNKIARGY